MVDILKSWAAGNVATGLLGFRRSLDVGRFRYVFVLVRNTILGEVENLDKTESLFGAVEP